MWRDVWTIELVIVRTALDVEIVVDRVPAKSSNRRERGILA